MILLLCAGLPRLSAAADCHTAQQAYAAGHHATARAQWQALADKGSAHAQLMIGTLHFNGQGVRQDYAEAVRWFERAADSGSADAALQLEQMYASGRGVARNIPEAIRLYRLAARQGNRYAQKALKRLGAD